MVVSIPPAKTMQDHSTTDKYILTVFPYRQHGVMAAKAEGIRENQINLLFARLVGNVIQITLRVGCFIVDGRRQDAIPHYLHTKDGFERTRRTHHMSRHGFC